jgi:glycosyltransferase involved in cell wall biosynthesis
MCTKISIITPSYNQGRFIERTIRSVLSQELTVELEYLVLDGGSTDETVTILKGYNDRVQWVSEKDHGQADAVNKGLARARGEMIGWINSDDIYYPGAITAAWEALRLHSEADVVYGEANHIDEADRIIESYPTEEWSFERLLETCYLCQPAVFFRKRVVDRYGLLNPCLHFCLDYEYWVRLARSGARFFRLGQVLAGSRLYAETKTLGSRVRVHAEINTMFLESLGRVPDTWLFNYAHAVLDEKRVPRSDPFRFPLYVAGLSLIAALRWNHSISHEVLIKAVKWIAAAARAFLGTYQK